MRVSETLGALCAVFFAYCLLLICLKKENVFVQNDIFFF